MEQQHLISVDLGGSKVTVALGRLSHNHEVVVMDAVSKPMDGFTRGEVTNIEHVTSAIREAVVELEARQGVKVEDVWVSLSGKHIVTASNSGSVWVAGVDGEITKNDVEKLHEDMNNVQAPESKIILERIPQNYKVDGNETIGSPVGRFGRKLETTFNYVLGGKIAIERITKAFQRAGVERLNFVASAMASGVVVASEEEKEAGVAVVDLGAGSTNICIYQNKIVRYVASIPVGSSAINNDIRTTAIPTNMIEKLKTKCGYATTSVIPADRLDLSVKINTRSPHQKNREITFRDLTTIIEARMLDIIEFVNSEIRASGYHNRLPGGIILTGGGSKLMGVDILFKERTGYDIRLGGAEGDISIDSMEGISAPELATAIGLLAIGIKKAGIAPSDPPVESEDNIEIVGAAETTETPYEKPEEVENDPQQPEDEEVEQDAKVEAKKKKEPRRSFWDRLKGLGTVLGNTVFGDVVDDEM